MDATEQTAEDAARAIGLDPETGFATDGNWPVNGRLRAEAMAKAGVTTDPAGIVSDDLIAATKDRVEREEAEEARAQAKADRAPSPSSRWTLERLTQEASSRNIPVTEDMDKAAILAAIEAAPAAQTTEG